MIANCEFFLALAIDSQSKHYSGTYRYGVDKRRFAIWSKTQSHNDDPCRLCDVRAYFVFGLHSFNLVLFESSCRSFKVRTGILACT